jgi:hypothetical protein
MYFASGSETRHPYFPGNHGVRSAPPLPPRSACSSDFPDLKPTSLLRADHQLRSSPAMNSTNHPQNELLRLPIIGAGMSPEDKATKPTGGYCRHCSRVTRHTWESAKQRVDELKSTPGVRNPICSTPTGVPKGQAALRSPIERGIGHSGAPAGKYRRRYPGREPVRTGRSACVGAGSTGDVRPEWQQSSIIPTSRSLTDLLILTYDAVDGLRPEMCRRRSPEHQRNVRIGDRELGLARPGDADLQRR